MSDPAPNPAAGDGAAGPATPEPSPGRASAVLTYLAQQLCDEPDSVDVELEATRRGSRLALRVAAGDMGRVIGRRGRIAQSIRTVVRAAGAAEGRDVSVDIVD